MDAERYVISHESKKIPLAGGFWEITVRDVIDKRSLASFVDDSYSRAYYQAKEFVREMIQNDRNYQI